MTVVGNGLLARYFNPSENNNVLYFASGVSNSKEQNPNSFERERLLLLNSLEKHSKKTFVYFSSIKTTIGDGSPYFMHKRKMEKIIQSIADHYLIIRLPQVVGDVNNSTLVSYLVSNIINNKPITINVNATRALIGVDDVCSIVMDVVENQRAKNSIVDLSPFISVHVLKIVEYISSLVGCSADIHAYNGFIDSPLINHSLLNELMHSNHPLRNPDYWKTVLSRYVPLIARNNEKD